MSFHLWWAIVPRVPGDFKEGFASGSAFPHRAGEINNGPAELHGPLVNQLQPGNMLGLQKLGVFVVVKGS